MKITVTEYAIHSSLTTFQVGVPYHFVVTNQGQVLHELMVVPASTATGSEDEIDRQRLFEVADIDVGQTKSEDFTFTQAEPSGFLQLACHQPGHFEMGMYLSITVTK